MLIVECEREQLTEGIDIDYLKLLFKAISAIIETVLPSIFFFRQAKQQNYRLQRKNYAFGPMLMFMVLLMH